MYRPIRYQVALTTVAAAAYAALAIVLLDPLFDDLWSGQIDPLRVFGGFLGGPRLDVFTWTLAWDWRALSAAVPLFDAPVHPPLEHALAATHTKLGHLPIFGPAYAATGNPSFAAQVTNLVNLVLSGTALFVLCRSWKLPVSASFFGGFVYAFAPARIRNLFDPSLLAGQYLPLALLFIDRTLRRARPADAVAAAFFCTWQMACSAPAAAATVPIAAAYTLARSALAPRPPLRAIVAVAVALAVAWLSAWWAQAATGAGVAAGELVVPNPLATRGAITWTGILGKPAATLPWELSIALEPHYGWLAALAIIVGLVFARRHPRATAGALAILVVSYLAALGDRLPLGPLGTWYDWLMSIAPGTASRSAPYFFSQQFLLGWSLLAALGTAVLVERIASRRALAGLAVAVLLLGTGFELGYGRAPVPTRSRPVGSGLPHAYSLLAERPAGTVVKLPVRPCSAESDMIENESLYLQTAHWQPVAVAKLDLEPLAAPMVRSLIGALPDPAATDALRRVSGLRYVAVHLAELDVEERERWRDPAGLKRLAISDQVLLFEAEQPPEPKIERAAGRSETVTGLPLAALPASERNASLAIDSAASTSVGFPIPARIQVTNRSNRAWPGVAVDATHLVTIGTRWIDENGEVAAETPMTARLPADLAPQQSVWVEVCIPSPDEPGNYRLIAGLVQHGEWFPTTSPPKTIALGALNF